MILHKQSLSNTLSDAILRENAQKLMDIPHGLSGQLLSPRFGLSRRSCAVIGQVGGDNQQRILIITDFRILATNEITDLPLDLTVHLAAVHSSQSFRCHRSLPGAARVIVGGWRRSWTSKVLFPAGVQLNDRFMVPSNRYTPRISAVARHANDAGTKTGVVSATHYLSSCACKGTYLPSILVPT